MKLSEARLSHLAHLLLEAASEDNLASPRNPRLFLNEVKRILSAGPGGVREDAIDTAVRRKIGSLSRKVPPGSPEWEVLYRKYREEEQRKRR